MAKPNELEELRRQAERRLPRGDLDVGDLSPDEVAELVHELRTHQVELEIQNEELRTAQEELVEARDRYQELYDFAPVGYVVLDERGAVVEANLAAGDLLGVPRGDLLGRPLSEFVAPAGQDTLYLHVRQLLEGTTRLGFELPLRGDDAAPLWVHMECVSERTEAGGTRIRASLSEVTASKRAEAALQEARDQLERRVKERTAALAESESRYRRLVEGSPGIFYVFSDKRGGVFYGSRVEDILGYSVEHLLANPFLWAESIHPDDRPAVQAAIAAFADGGSFQLEYRIRHVEGHWVWLEDRSIGRRTEGDEILIEGMATDITTRKRAEEDRQQLLTRLVTAQEDERQALSRELHDETSQQLTALQLGVQWLRKHHDLPAGAVEELRELEVRLDALAASTRRLAVEVRPPALDELGLNAALREYVEHHLPHAGASVSFQCVGLQGDRLPQSLEVSLYRVVQEALTNAARYANASSISVVVQRRGNEVLALIEDDGVGFDPDDLPPADQGRARLGLLGMRERVELAGGSLTVESEPGYGTLIRASLPVPNPRPGERPL